MEWINFKFVNNCWFLLLFVISSVAQGVQPVLSEAVVTDVTDRAFSLIWTTDQSGQPSIEIFSDAAGTQPVTSGLTITPYEIFTGNPVLDESGRQASKDSITQSAKTFGIVRMTVSGLVAGTDYFLKFGLQADATLETTLCPDAGESFCPNAGITLLAIRTEQLPIRVSTASQLFLNDYLLVLNVTAQSGELVIVGAETANYPVSAFIGDGAPVPYAIIDLNNFFTAVSNQSIQITGSNVKTFGDVGEGLIVRHYKGTSGSVTDVQVVGINQGTGALMTPIDRDYGDCNNNGRIDSYDHLLLENVVAGILPSADYVSVAFHSVLCNLYKEDGLNSLKTSVVLDIEDGTRLKALLIGKTPVSNLPEAP